MDGSGDEGSGVRLPPERIYRKQQPMLFFFAFFAYFAVKSFLFNRKERKGRKENVQVDNAVNTTAAPSKSVRPSA